MLLSWGNWLHGRFWKFIYTFGFYWKIYPYWKIKKWINKIYIHGITKPVHQGQLEGSLTKKAYADDTYKGHKVAEFNVKLTNSGAVV